MHNRRSFILLIFAVIIGIAAGWLFAEPLSAFAPTALDDVGWRGYAANFYTVCREPIKLILAMLTAGFTVFAVPMSMISAAVFAAIQVSAAAVKISEASKTSEMISAAALTLIALAAIYLYLCTAARTVRFSAAARSGLTDAKSLFLSRGTLRYLSDSLTLTGLLLATLLAISLLMR